jgi:molybdopterin molybdotransferase
MHPGPAMFGPKAFTTCADPIGCGLLERGGVRREWDRCGSHRLGITKGVRGDSSAATGGKSFAGHNGHVPPLPFHKAREVVIQSVRAARRSPAIETVDLLGAAGRVLAEPIAADRETPPTSRSVRDGFAIRAADAPGEFEIIGEVRAGNRFEDPVDWRQAVEIMTGAPIPPGADAVVMVEHVARTGNRITVDQPVEAQQFINPHGCEAAADEVVLRAGKRLDYSDIAMLAAFGHRRVQVYRKLTVAIVATGDEIVDVDSTPADYQIRNSNAYSLAAQVLRAGGKPSVLPLARDTVEETREIVERGLNADLLLLSGGVSAGKYDIVEKVLAGLNAEFYFDRVLIQPGQPVVFGQARGKFFFGLPGNPASTMVTFEIFARVALELLSGQDDVSLYMPFAKLTREFKHREGITRFLPARLSEDGTSVTPTGWHGSGDIPAMTRANAYLVADADCPVYESGALIRVLPK